MKIEGLVDIMQITKVGRVQIYLSVETFEETVKAHDEVVSFDGIRPAVMFIK